MIILLQKKVDIKRSTMAFILATFAWGSPPQAATASVLLLPERQAESCPDDLKSMDFCVPFILLLYQIDHLCVK